MAASRASSKAQLLQVKEERAGRTPSSRCRIRRRITLERYAVADTLAVHFAGLYPAATRKMFGWVFVSALFFNLFHSLPHAHLPEHPSLGERLLALPWLLLLFLAIVDRRELLDPDRDVKEQDYQNKHQDYRALAEALRIQFFWHVAGVSEKVVDHYLRKQRGALEWIRNALRAWDAEVARRTNRARQQAAVSRRTAGLRGQHWVSEQRNYYASKAQARTGDARGRGPENRVAGASERRPGAAAGAGAHLAAARPGARTRGDQAPGSKTRGFTA